jgi:hypothetical protein
MPDYFMYEVLPFYVIWAVGTMCTTVYLSKKETR